VDNFHFGISAQRAQPKKAWRYPYPLGASYSILSYMLDNNAVLCAPPFRAVPLICPNCPVPHDLGLVYVRVDRPRVPLWCLYVSDAVGAA
jgi:hypothetical protein